MGMERLYKKFKGRVVEYPGDVSGVICGWVEDNLIIAIEGKKPIYSFRKFDKTDHYVEEIYRDPKFKYAYCSESTAEKSKKIK